MTGRLAVVALAACGIVLLAGCGSNNAGKIVGKWKMVTAPPGLNAEERQLLQESQSYPFIEFRADGTLVHGIESANPDVSAALKETESASVGTGRYDLLPGNGVRLSGFPSDDEGPGIFRKESEGRFTVSVDGDAMTMSASNVTLRLTRIK